MELLGSRLSLEDAAAALSKAEQPLHLDAFVSANEDRWRARYGGVVPHGDREISGWWVTDRMLALGAGRASIAVTAGTRKWQSIGMDLGQRAFRDVRSTIGSDRLLSLDAREGTTSIKLSGEEALPSERIDQVVSWTDQVEGITVETDVARERVTLAISFVEGRIRSSKDLPIGQFARRARRYFGLGQDEGSKQGQPAA